jgi:flagellar biosynthesis anti-sigma factor FlgM
MRIDLNTGIGQAADAQQPASGARNTPAVSSADARGTDTAQLSTDQARVQALAAQVNALPEIRQEKVAALGQAVRDGSYQVSPEQTADALISEMLSHSAAA